MSDSTQKTVISNHFVPYKQYITEKSTYVNKLKLTVIFNGFVVNTP